MVVQAHARLIFPTYRARRFPHGRAACSGYTVIPALPIAVLFVFPVWSASARSGTDTGNFVQRAKRGAPQPQPWRPEINRHPGWASVTRLPPPYATAFFRCFSLFKFDPLDEHGLCFLEAAKITREICLQVVGSAIHVRDSGFPQRFQKIEMFLFLFHILFLDRFGGLICISAETRNSFRPFLLTGYYSIRHRYPSRRKICGACDRERCTVEHAAGLDA